MCWADRLVVKPSGIVTMLTWTSLLSRALSDLSRWVWLASVYISYLWRLQWNNNMTSPSKCLRILCCKGKYVGIILLYFLNNKVTICFQRYSSCDYPDRRFRYLYFWTFWFVESSCPCKHVTIFRSKEKVIVPTVLACLVNGNNWHWRWGQVNKWRTLTLSCTVVCPVCAGYLMGVCDSRPCNNKLQFLTGVVKSNQISLVIPAGRLDVNYYRLYSCQKLARWHTVRS